MDATMDMAMEDVEAYMAIETLFTSFIQILLMFLISQDDRELQETANYWSTCSQSSSTN